MIFPQLLGLGEAQCVREAGCGEMLDPCIDGGGSAEVVSIGKYADRHPAGMVRPC